MDHYEKWNENRPKITSGKYVLKCLMASKKSIWHEGQGGYGRSEKVVLWFQIIEGEHRGVVIPMFLPIGKNGKIHQGSKYYIAWCIANGLRKPSRGRLKEMPPSKFVDKLFLGEVVDTKPKWKNGQVVPSIFHYSRVDALYELIVGNPDD